MSPASLRPSIESAFAVAAYRSGWDPGKGDAASRLLRALKRAITPVALDAFGVVMGSFLAFRTALGADVDLVIPVPTSLARAQRWGGAFRVGLTTEPATVRRVWRLSVIAGV